MAPVVKGTVKSIPVGEHYVEPMIEENVQHIDYFEVNNELFLNKSAAQRKAKKDKTDVVERTGPVTVYSVGNDRFLDTGKAEKKLKSLVKKYRDEVRETVRVYGVDKASQAAKLPHLDWLVRHYPLDELKNANFFWALNADEESKIRALLAEHVYNPYVMEKFDGEIVDPLDTTYPLEYLFANKPYSDAGYCSIPFRALVVFKGDLDIYKIQRDHQWSWMKNATLDGCHVPAHLVPQSVERSRWVVDNSKLQYEKVYKVTNLVDYRLGELLYAAAIRLATVDGAGNVLSVPPLDTALFQVEQSLVEEELAGIIEFIDTHENGVDLHFAVKGGEPVYWLNGDKRNVNPFKQF